MPLDERINITMLKHIIHIVNKDWAVFAYLKSAPGYSILRVGREHFLGKGRVMVLEEQKNRNWAMGCHLAALALYIGIPFGNIFGPLIIWLIKKDEIPLVDEQGKESLNFQISLILYGVAMVILIALFSFTIVLIPGCSSGHITYGYRSGQPGLDYLCCLKGQQWRVI